MIETKPKEASGARVADWARARWRFQVGSARLHGRIARAGQLGRRRSGRYRDPEAAEATAPFYIGKGKAEAIKESVQSQGVTSVIFNDELSPAQGRNLENLLSRKVLDRTQLILDIFAQRARSREGRLQIELAQLRYLLPRLTRMWHHLSRQTGGIGTRGPGETQLEVDRRRVQDRIARLERELEGVRKVRSVQRQGRKRHQWPVAAVVGYTNAGKSTLLNLMTGADVLAVDNFSPLSILRRAVSLSPINSAFCLPIPWDFCATCRIP